MKCLIISLLLSVSFVALGQRAEIVFEKTTHEFGVISEDGGVVSHDFEFTNKGHSPLIITNVRTSCGCTTPSWTREPVAPGQKGIIKVSYDPKRRPGRFSKSITVSSNATKPVVALTIKGDVKRKPADPYARYKFNLGTVKLTGNNMNFGTIKNTTVSERKLDIINMGDTPEKLQLKSASPYITFSTTPEVLEKGKTGTLNIKYDAGKRNDWDFVSDQITIVNSSGESMNITVTANIQEDFSAQEAEGFANSPQAVFSETNADLGEIKANGNYKREFYIENTGKSNLIIRKIKTNDQSVTVEAGRNQTIKPGKKNKITIHYKSDEKPGKIIKMISFILNDPKNKMVNYRLNAEVI